MIVAGAYEIFRWLTLSQAGACRSSCRDRNWRRLPAHNDYGDSVSRITTNVLGRFTKKVLRIAMISRAYLRRMAPGNGAYFPEPAVSPMTI